MCRRIEQATRGQAESPLWRKMRQMRLTASNFGRVFKRIRSRHPTSLLNSLLSNKSVDTASTRWGKSHECDAVEEYETLSGRKTQECGLFVNPRFCWLGASLDRLVTDPAKKLSTDGLLEIKCPFSAREMTVQEYQKQNRPVFHSQMDRCT